MARLWPEPDDPNLANALAGYVSSGAPLVAGFELAAIVLLLTGDGIADHVPLEGPAVLAMVVSVMLMVFSIRYGFWAVSYWTTPAERVMWHPAALINDEALDGERYALDGRLEYFRALRNRAEHLFQLGIMAFLLAIALMLVPARWHAASVGWRWAAFGAAGLAIVVHVLWSFGIWLQHRIEHRYLTLAAKLADTGNARWARKKSSWERRQTSLQSRGDAFLLLLSVIWPPAKPQPDKTLEPADADELRGLRRQ